MNIKPLYDYVVIKAMAEEVTKSGIVLPDTISKEKPEQGEVMAVGEGKLLENGQRAAMSVKVGDRVIFRKYAANEMKIEGQEYLIVREGDVIAIVG
jgi:chaperonin GroES